MIRLRIQMKVRPVKKVGKFISAAKLEGCWKCARVDRFICFIKVIFYSMIYIYKIALGISYAWRCFTFMCVEFLRVWSVADVFDSGTFIEWIWKRYVPGNLINLVVYNINSENPNQSIVRNIIGFGRYVNHI